MHSGCWKRKLSTFGKSNSKKQATMVFPTSFSESLRSGDFTVIHILEDGLMKEYKLGFYKKKEQPNKYQGEQEG